MSPYEAADATMKTLVEIAMREREKLQDAEIQKKYLLASQKFNNKWKEVRAAEELNGRGEGEEAKMGKGSKTKKGN
jgi:hypothetical protein